VSSTVRRQLAIEATPTQSRSLLQLLHQHFETRAFFSEDVAGRDATIFEEQLAGILAAKPELIELCAPRTNPGLSASTSIRLTPLCGGFALGSVLQTTITRSAICPLEMNVFDPFST